MVTFWHGNAIVVVYDEVSMILPVWVPAGGSLAVTAANSPAAPPLYPGMTEPAPAVEPSHRHQLRGVGQPFQGLVADEGGVGQRVLKGGQRGLKSLQLLLSTDIDLALGAARFNTLLKPGVNVQAPSDLRTESRGVVGFRGAVRSTTR